MPQTQSEIEKAYDEFSQALNELRRQQQAILNRASKDMEWMALDKIRKQIGI